LGAANKPTLLVLNKIDKLLDEDRQVLMREVAHSHPEVAAVSALTGEGVEALLEKLDAAMPGDPLQTVRFRFPQKDAAALSMLYDNARILRRDYVDGAVEVDAEAPQSLVSRLDRFVAAGE
jgi:GTP-binding protein HflX